MNEKPNLELNIFLYRDCRLAKNETMRKEGKKRVKYIILSKLPHRSLHVASPPPSPPLPPPSLYVTCSEPWVKGTVKKVNLAPQQPRYVHQREQVLS
ncbi:hypothetical protein E2C01_017155 [Portunus trituberculatus]|uniref:Uncharacterized protein n=1 Tax=Portunus trituberculatus TaxID=210409 RepID=A0A5B7DSM2_PORTR|nr:hypothetical protein [Portunus trituberculatus]